MARIARVTARQIFDSRGTPTVEADVILEDGSLGRAAVPSGASTGIHEAHELRDQEDAYFGQGVSKAVQNIHEEIARALDGADAGAQGDIDRVLIESDGTENKERLGANAMLAVSLATAKAEALSRGQFFYEYVGSLSRMERAPLLPMPLCNVLNGGRHASGSTDIQEYMLIPVGAESFTEAMRMATEVFHALKRVLADAEYTTLVGDEGGFAPRVTKGNREALELLTVAVEKAGYAPGADIAFAIDAAASELIDGDNRYFFKSEERTLERGELIDYYAALSGEFPLISIEDGLAEEDWEGWKELTERLGEGIQLVGDDLLVTNSTFLRRAIEEKAGNAILIKPNQVGTLTETIETVDTAHEAGWSTILSHRSGETEDTTIAHLAVGLAAGQIKAGSLSRSERLAKYNELLRIEESLGERALFNGRAQGASA